MRLEEILLITGIFVGVGFFLYLLGIREEKNRKKYIRLLMKERYGKRNEKTTEPSHKECIKSYYLRHKDADSVDDITWNDLSMDRLFEQMNQTFSSAGEEYLYYMLRTLRFEEAPLQCLEADVSFFMKEQECRETLWEQLAGIGKMDRYSLYDYLEFTSANHESISNKEHYFGILLTVSSFVLIFFHTGIGILVFLAVLAYDILRYYKVKSKILPYISTLRHVMRMIHTARKVSSLQKEITKGNNILTQSFVSITDAENILRKFSRRSGYVLESEAVNSNMMGMFRDYFNMIFHLDLIQFNHMIRELEQHEDSVDVLVGGLGYMEAVIVVGSFRKALGSYCIPVFNGKNNGIAVYHPLIKQPVKNDYEFNRGMLLTGSNASGKSTFLKTVAINMILSQTIHTSCADSMETGFYRILTSMALSDNLEAKESYFMAEIRSMKRIADCHRTPGADVVCFVDEILRGTNTVERIAASTEILRFLAKQGILCMGATHDIELTTLLEQDYDNYHFEERMEEDDVCFDYRLRKGKATSKNAIKLLETLGYDKGLVERAKDLADYFTSSGKWM